MPYIWVTIITPTRLVPVRYSLRYSPG